jgi:integrase
MPTRRYTVRVDEHPRSPFWWATAYFEGEGGRRQRWSTGVRVDLPAGRRESRRLAEEGAEREARRRANLAEAPAPDQGAALSAIARRLLKQKLADGRRQRAVESIQQNLDTHVLDFFGRDRDVRTIRRADLEAFKRKLHENGKAPTTINNALTAVRQILKLAHVEELIEAVPEVRNVRVSSESKGRALTPEEVLALLNNIDPRYPEARQYLAFVVNTGLRKSEANAMKWGWIDWERRLMRVPASVRKGARSGLVVPLNDAALAILDERFSHGTKRGKPLPTGPDDRVWLNKKHDRARNSAATAAGLGRVRTHDLRHTRGSLLYAAGASLPEVRDLLGHKTMAMVNRYAHSYGERLQEVAERVSIGVAGRVAGSRSASSERKSRSDTRPKRGKTRKST